MSKDSWQAISPDDDYSKWIERTTENHKKFNEENQSVKDIKYGLMVIDPTQEGEMMNILHFVGYWEKPTKTDADSLREELMNDEEFGLTEIAHRLDILPAPDYIVKEFMDKVEDDE